MAVPGLPCTWLVEEQLVSLILCHAAALLPWPAPAGQCCSRQLVQTCYSSVMFSFWDFCVSEGLFSAI